MNCFRAILMGLGGLPEAWATTYRLGAVEI